MATNTIDPTILQMLTALTERVERLEQALSAKDGVHEHDPIVATYVEDGVTFDVTQSEAAAMRNSLRKKSSRRPDEVIHRMVLTEKMLPYHKKQRTNEERKQLMIEAMDVSRACAIADGSAIDEEWEAAIDD